MEIWKPFRHGYYEVSNLGRVRRVKPGGRNTYPGRVLKGRRNSKGYSIVTSYYHGRIKAHAIHVLVAAAFIGPRPLGKEIHHKDFDKTNNRWDNLKYKTHVKHIRHHHSRLNWHKVRKIRSLYDKGETQRYIAIKFRVSQSSISHIVNQKHWTVAA
jgi:HNH endonuclease/NUMOD4 motif-containing protein